MSSLIAQTFNIFTEQTQGQEGLFVSSIDLFFEQIDALFGCTVELRTTVNGFPTESIVPFSTVHLASSQIKASSDASLSTRFSFSAPVFLNTSSEYAFVIMPDGNSSNYLIWTSVIGENDVTVPSRIVRSDWGQGTMYTNTDSANWVGVNNEVIKFTLNQSVFSSNNATLTLVNKDEEYFSVKNVNGNFAQGEMLFQFTPTPIAGLVTFTAGNNVVIGTGTNFLTGLSSNNYLVLTSTPAPVPVAYFSVGRIASISNNTYLTLQNPPAFGATNVAALNTPCGRVMHYNPLTNNLDLTSSSAANSSFLFKAGGLVIGSLTGSSASIANVANKSISYYQPLIYRTQVSGTNISANNILTDTTFTVRDTVPMKFNDTNYLNSYEVIVASKSNEIAQGTGKSVQIPITLSSSSSMVSPTIDLQSSAILRYTNIINSDTTNESTVNGSTLSKYVSRVVTLAPGQYAEDMHVFATSYEPTGTEIQIYAKIVNDTDPVDDLSSKAWTKLGRVGTVVNGDPSNRNDFKNYAYSFNNTAASTPITGLISATTGSNVFTGLNTAFTSALTLQSTVLVTNNATSAYFVAQVLAINSDTSVTLSVASPSTFKGGSIAVFSNPSAAFLDSLNGGVASYYLNGTKYAGYRYFMLKILELSNTNYIVPRCSSVRAIALSI